MLDKGEVESRPDANAEVNGYTSIGPGKRRALNWEKGADALIERVEGVKSALQAQMGY